MIVFIRCRSVVTDRGMAASLVLCWLLANAACFLAVPIQTVDYIDYDQLLSTFFNNDIDGFIEDNDVGTLRNLQESSYECKNLYSHICDRKSETNIFSNHEFKQKTSEFYSTFKQKITDLLSNSEDENSETPSVNLEHQLYRRCMNLGSNDEKNNENNEENNIKYHDNDKLNYVTDTDENVRYNEIENEPVNQIFSKILKSFGHKNIFTKTWQQLDQKLAAIGFGHAFYDISVMANPYVPNKNIILLQPPSIKKWNSIKFIDTLSDIYVHFQIQLYEQCTEGSSETSNESKESNLNDSDHESEDESEESGSKSKTSFNSDEGPAFLESDEDETKDVALASQSHEVNSLCKPYQSLSETDVVEKIINIDDEIILVFFNRLLKAMFDSISATNKEDFYTKLTIKEWNKKYNSLTQRATSKIDWFEVIKSEFEQVGITIDDTENIFIKNVPYFHKLAKYLKYHSNKIFDKAVRSKFIAENARYIDWDWMQSVNTIDQSTFCLEQTQLYGVSQKALKSMRNEFSNPHVEVVAVIMNNIADVLYRNISENWYLTDLQKTYMKAQLLTMTNHLLSNIYDGSDHDSIFDDYYANFKATNDYFVDINIYRRTVKNSILKRLRDKTPLSYEYLPFDINEIENPRNRLILYTLSNIYIDSLKSPMYFNTTEKYYATFGVKLAGFLYSLIVEDKFQTDVHDLHGSQWLNTHITYSPKVVKCFVPENIVAYGYPLAYSTITEIFSVRIALEAMLKDSKDASIHDFYKTYIESHCSTKDQKMTHKVLSNLAHISTAFDCSDKSVEQKCDVSIFQA